MDAVRSTVRVITQTALVTAAVTERTAAATLRWAVGRAPRTTDYDDLAAYDSWSSATGLGPLRERPRTQP
ncbi:MAG: hypothetical protein QOH60_2564 [Mycobacterium sp.]|jgi:hypothetical protein|nr:hypothetical protein [Mycobacterium sp.]